MANNLGPGVSRVLNPDATEYVEVILQQGKPPMDAEFNLLQELGVNYTRKATLRGMPSGWLGNDTNSSAVYDTNARWSNWFKFGKQRPAEQKPVLWAAVNGWLIPVTGTRTGTPPGSPDDADTWNKIALDPPPSNAGDFRIDYVFLEVWQARIPPNPSSTNKPSASAVYRYGNVEGGYSFLPDDLVDPALGFETSQRVQIQYRIRVVKGLVGLTSNPDGFDPATVKAQGAASTPTSFTFQNMRQALGDAGLWRAGDGTTNGLGTVDGYVYAIPIAAVFRRNSIVWTGDPSQNLNGGFDRNPTAVDRTGVTTFSTDPALSVDLSATSLSATLASASNIPLPLTPLTPVLIQIGDEQLQYQSITGGGVMTILARGVNGSRAEAHKAGTPVKVISGRPDGLFSDQVALNDVLDLRHVVSGNGFDYNALLSENLDRLLQGQLRTNWKRSGSGTQGKFVFYQDKITNGSAATGITKLDGPDNIRSIFSDAACPQRIEVIVKPTAAAAPVPVNESWSLALQVNLTTKVSVGNVFGAGDVLTIPVNQLKAGLPGGDADQVRWMFDGQAVNFSLRVDGETSPLDPSCYTITPTNPTSSDDLVVTFGPSFPTTAQRLYLVVHCIYGAGRGLSRRPDSFHSVSLLFPSADLLLNQQQVATNSFSLRTTWVPFWGKYANGDAPRIPVTSEAYTDLGSKTLVLQPLRRIDLPDSVITFDGTSPNQRPTSFATGTGNASASQFQGAGVNFVTAGAAVGDSIVISGGPQPGRYVITSIFTTGVPNDTVGLDRPVPTFVGANFAVFKGQGLMPLFKVDGVTPKYTTTDPLGIFSGTTDPTPATKNIYITFPRGLVPSWGEYDLPLLWQDQVPFSQGMNYLLNVPSGAGPFANAEKNYIPFSYGAFSYASFSTLDLTPPGTNPAPYNGTFTFGGKQYAGIRKFTDPRGLGRQGLELPPFYGPARLWAVYEANDYKINGSAFGAGDRAPTGSLSAAKNLLRQNCDVPLFWIELDDDGDSTFILNAEALDLTKSTVNPIANFAAGNYVIEASIYGFDRDAFNNSKEFRLVLSRQRSEAVSPVRASNITASIDAPELIVPSPVTNSDEVLINFSRTPYQGDAWGSQTVYQDIGYAPGPLQSGEVVALMSQGLNQDALTRPNQKVLEVLAETGFTTTLGTGRLPVASYSIDPNPGQVGFEAKDAAPWPPANPVSPRPPIKLDALQGDEGFPPGQSYLGCTERLPLGALFRDKDFRGNSYMPDAATGFRYHNDTFKALFTSIQRQSNVEETQIPLGNSDIGGATGTFVAHVDGNQGNYSLLTNYRVNRGGSLFAASGPYPGGEVAAVYPRALHAPPGGADTRVTVLVGRAYLVRNTVTNLGLAEVSAGNELMMLIQTTAYYLTSPVDPQGWYTVVSTNGTAEGNSAADLYHIEGKPIVNDFRKVTIDPSNITLTRRILPPLRP
jgi:hypothetical protein